MFIFPVFQLWFGKNQPLIYHFRQENIERGAKGRGDTREAAGGNGV